MNRQQSGRERSNKFTVKMQKKLVVLFIFILLAFVGLGARLAMINKENGERYKKQVLSQQQYDSRTIPFRRGDILDSKGTPLAVSEKVYDVILDTYQVMEDKKYLEPTMKALKSQFDFDEQAVRKYMADNPGSRYYILAKTLTIDQISGFKALQQGTGEVVDGKKDEGNPNIQGVWFEPRYIRNYPNGSLACDAIGFTNKDNWGTYGLEEFYNDILSGTAGREYGYLNDDSTLERTTIAAADGNSIVTTIDANIQGIVEKHLKAYDDEYKNLVREANGSENAGCIIMDVNSGEILAMASYPSYDLNDPKNTENLIGMPMVDELGNKVKPTQYITAEDVETMEGDLLYQNYNSLWKNFCIADTYEPGSVSKPFTVAGALESGSITGNEVYECGGFLEIGGHKIHCHNRYGDGPLTVAEAVERSCNVCLMHIGQAMGTGNYLKWQHIFNFGLKTNVDLAGEARTANLIYEGSAMGPTELATNTFGQGFNATMIQVIAGFCSLINGGYYYEPHMVSRIVSPNGGTVQNIEPRVLKQTISATTSDKILEYCNGVVTGEKGTGKTARPAGYMIGGKTGTAQTLPRGNNEYVVSFMGYAPADDPQILIYVVVDRPNVDFQDDAKFATRIVRSILTEVLPYLGFFMTEELTEEEKAELEALHIEMLAPPADVSGNDLQDTEEGGTEGSGQSGEAQVDNQGAGQGNGEDTGQDSGQEGPETEEPHVDIWKTFPIDPATGYAVDPDNGNLVDPETGAVINAGSFIEDVKETETPEPEAENGE